MHRAVSVEKLWDGVPHSEMLIRLDALQREIDLPQEVVQQRLELLGTVVPGLVVSLMRVTKLAELIQEADTVPVKMVRVCVYLQFNANSRFSKSSANAHVIQALPSTNPNVAAISTLPI